MPLLSDAIQDARYALRALRRYSAFSAAIIAPLAFVIGANALVFCTVNAVLLRPLPYPHSDQLVRLIENVPAEESRSGQSERSSGMSPEVFGDWQQRTRTLSHLGLHVPVALTLRDRTESVRLAGWRVSAGLLPMFETPPFLGRLFRDDEDRAGAERVVILGYATWKTRFGADVRIVGSSVTLNDAAYTVIGVMPSGFSPFDRPADFWIPF